MRATSANVCSANVNHRSQIEARRSGAVQPIHDSGPKHERKKVQHGRVVKRAELVVEHLEIDLWLREDFRVGDTGIFQLFRAGLQYRFIIPNQLAVFG